MANTSVWEEAWNKAQPRLSSLRNRLNLHGSPNPRIIRVGQLDSELLDREIVQLLQEPLNNTLSLINTSLKARFEPELRLLIQLILYKLSIWNTGASYGAKLQDLRYIVPPSSDRNSAQSDIPRRILVIHGALTIVLPYLHTKLRRYALSSAWPDAPSSDRRRKAWDVMTSVESMYALLALTSFIVFLWDGQHRTIADRLLKMRLVPLRKLVKRDVSYEFMNRQMVWHAFTEFLLFFLPLVNARTIRRRINRLRSSLLPPSSLLALLPFKPPSPPSRDQQKITHGKYWSLPRDQCAICAENASFNLNLADSATVLTALAARPYQLSTASTPESLSAESSVEPPPYPIYNPYIASCGDLYCYHCITERMMRVADDGEDDRWECLRCLEIVKSAERYAVESDSKASESDYDLSSDFDMDTADISGSMGSYTESEGYESGHG